MDYYIRLHKGCHSKVPARICFSTLILSIENMNLSIKTIQGSKEAYDLDVICQRLEENLIQMSSPLREDSDTSKEIDHTEDAGEGSEYLDGNNDCGCHAYLKKPDQSGNGLSCI